MLQLVKTADGSNTIYNPLVGENYHSKHGALQESRHVFLNAGLKYFIENQSDPNEVSILEVGFGTGLNFLLSADLCLENNIKLEYTGIEAYPLTLEMISQTGYQEYISEPTWSKFIGYYGAALSSPVNINTGIKLHLAAIPLMNFNSAKQYDVIYFDAFGAASQPEMWGDEAIARTIQFLKPGGVFVTYAITGNLKRALKALNCKVEKLAGAPGKREMLRAQKT